METTKENQLLFSEQVKKNARKVKYQQSLNSEETIQTHQALIVALGLSGHVFTKNWLHS